ARAEHREPRDHREMEHVAGLATSRARRRGEGTVGEDFLFGREDLEQVRVRAGSDGDERRAVRLRKDRLRGLWRLERPLARGGDADDVAARGNTIYGGAVRRREPRELFRGGDGDGAEPQLQENGTAA